MTGGMPHIFGVCVLHSPSSRAGWNAIHFSVSHPNDFKYRIIARSNDRLRSIAKKVAHDAHMV